MLIDITAPDAVDGRSSRREVPSLPAAPLARRFALCPPKLIIPHNRLTDLYHRLASSFQLKRDDVCTGSNLAVES